MEASLYIWVIVALFFVVGVKYYTSREMANLERRLHAVKSALHSKKQEFDAVQNNQEETQQAEVAMEDRIKHMKEIIQDVNIRLTQTDTAPETSSMTVQNMMEREL